MGTTKSQSRKRLSWALAFLVSGLLYAPMIAMAQTTEETEPPNEDDEETPVCPEEPFFRFSDEEVAETGLSRELLCVVADTALFRYDPPGPNESPDLLRRVLRRGPYKNLSDEQYRAVMEEAVRLWPQSHYAHAGLAQALLGGHGIRGTPADRRRAADEFLIAADIVFSKGGVRYVTELSQLLADLKDKEALDRYFQRVFDILPDGRGRYESYLDYAFALGKLGDERAETYFQKAIAVSPKGVGDAYDFYGRYLLDHGKAQKLLELLALNSKAEQVMYPPVFHYQRCQALEQLGRKAEAVVECQQARDLRPPSIRETPSPVGRPGSGPLSRGPRAPAEPGLLARLLGVGLAQAADYQNPTDDCLESQTLNRCDDYPDDPAHDCYFDYVWNFAELIEVEAKAETYGSRADVAWTVRDRVWRESTPACGNFPGADGTCTSTCSEIGPFCELQIKYCCVIRSGSFSFQHRAVSFENLKLAADVITSYTPEPTSGFKPTGASGCTTGVCDKSLACSNSGNLYEYAPEGPIYFYANCKKIPTAQPPVTQRAKVFNLVFQSPVMSLRRRLVVTVPMESARIIATAGRREIGHGMLAQISPLLQKSRLYTTPNDSR